MVNIFENFSIYQLIEKQSARIKHHTNCALADGAESSAHRTNSYCVSLMRFSGANSIINLSICTI